MLFSLIVSVNLGVQAAITLAIVLSLLATATHSASIKRDADAHAQTSNRVARKAVNLVKDEELINFWNEEWEGQNEEMSDAGKDVVLQLLRNISTNEELNGSDDVISASQQQQQHDESEPNFWGET